MAPENDPQDPPEDGAQALEPGGVVLMAGMHRSGTSALARVFNLLGADLPEPLVPPSLGNELGHWEPAEVVAMNDRALLAAGSDVNDMHPLAAEWRASDAYAVFVEEVRAYVQRVSRPGRLVVVKDPRIAVLAAPWREGVERAGLAPRFLIAFRDPWEVARSLSRRQLEHFPDEVWPHARVVALWLKHHLELERASRGARRSFTGYADLMRDWRGEVERTRRQLGLAPLVPSPAQTEAVEAFLRPDAHRQRRTDQTGEPGVAGEVLDALQARIADPDGGADAFDAADDRLAQAGALLGDYLAALEARVRENAEGRASADDAQVVIRALQTAAETAEVRAVEALSPAPTLASLAVDSDPERLAILERRHAELRDLHAAVAAELRTGRAAWEHERERLTARLEACEAEHAEGVATSRTVSAALSRLEAEHMSTAAERDRLKAQRRAAVAGSEQLQDDLERSEARCVALRDTVDRLNHEIESHRSAYAEADRAAADARARLNAQAADLQLAVHRAAEDRLAHQARTRLLEADLDGRRLGTASAQAEVEALRASTSWKVTRPLRSVTFRLRRLARR